MAYIPCTDCSAGRGPVIMSVWPRYGTYISADFANTTSYNTLIHCHTCALGTPLSLHHHTHLHLHTFIRVQGLYTSLYFVTQVFMRVPTMPPKKKANSQPDQGPVALQNTLSSEGTDPMSMAIAVIDKKARNLEKRKVWSSQSVRLSVCFGTRVLMAVR